MFVVKFTVEKQSCLFTVLGILMVASLHQVNKQDPKLETNPYSASKVPSPWKGQKDKGMGLWPTEEVQKYRCKGRGILH